MFCTAQCIPSMSMHANKYVSWYALVVMVFMVVIEQ